MTSVQPFRFAAITAERPTDPVPKTTIDDPACGSRVLMTPPAPV
jgi:hypothetical protein